VVEEFVWHLTGKETIYQMMALADAVRTRGGQPLEPAVYKKMYLDRLWLKIRDRIEGLRAAASGRKRFLYRAHERYSKSFRARFTALSRERYRRRQCQRRSTLLGVAPFFEDRIFGAQDDLTSFSKAILVRQIVSRAGFEANELLVFGDGYVEIEKSKK